MSFDFLSGNQKQELLEQYQKITSNGFLKHLKQYQLSIFEK